MKQRERLMGDAPRLTLESEEMRKIIEADAAGLQIHLFVKKSDSEGTDFYYMGKVHPVSYEQKTIADDNGKLLPIVNFKLELENPVQDDIYDYFEGSQPIAIAG